MEDKKGSVYLAANPNISENLVFSIGVIKPGQQGWWPVFVGDFGEGASQLFGPVFIEASRIVGDVYVTVSPGLKDTRVADLERWVMRSRVE